MPGGRYSRWVHARLVGDPQAAAPYLSVGRKLLGQLDQQRADGGPTTLTLRRELLDGAVVTASFYGQQPIIEVVPPPGGPKKPEPAQLVGFLSRPQSAANPAERGEHPEIVLTPLQSWGTRFFDPTYYPDPPEGSQLLRGRYDRGPDTRPLFPEGLPDWGGVDWRNAAETLCVSWIGPTARYFGRDQLGPYVFRNGQVLLDVGPLMPDLVPGIVQPRVMGACLRQHGDEDEDTAPGLWLYAIVYDRPTFSAAAFYVVRAPLATDRYAGAGPAPTLRQEPRLQCGPLELLHTQPFATADYAQQVHPWCFNQSGTVAKRITVSLPGGAATQACEQTYDLTDPLVPAFSETHHPNGTRALSDAFTTVTHKSIDKVGAALELTHDGDDVWPPSPSEAPAAPAAVDYTDRLTPVGVRSSDGSAPALLVYPSDVTHVASTTPSVLQWPVAVDFVDDTAVYAFAERDPAVNTYHYARTSAIAANQTDASLTGNWTDVGGDIQLTDAYLLDQWAVSTQDAVVETRDSSAVLRLVLPWGLTLEDATTRAYSFTPTLTTGDAVDRRINVIGSASPAFEDHARTLAYEFAFSDTETEAALYLWHLDLRSGMAAYSVLTETVSTVTSGEASGSGASLPVILTVPVTGTAATLRTLTTTVQRGTEVLDTTSATLEDTVTPIAVDHDVNDGFGTEFVNPFAAGPVVRALTAGEIARIQESGTLGNLPGGVTAVTGGLVPYGLFEPPGGMGTSTEAAGSDSAPTSSSAAGQVPLVRDATSLTSTLGTWIRTTLNLPPSGSSVHYYGGWQSLHGHWCFSQPWPSEDTPTVPRWRNTSSGGELDVITGLVDPPIDFFFPLTILPPVALTAPAR